MRAVTTDEQTPVYASTSDQTISIATLHKGEEFDLGKVTKVRREAWVEVTLDSGVKGYISGNAKIFGIRKVELQVNSAEMHQEPSSESPVVRALKKGDLFETLRIEENGDERWVRIRDLRNLEGYIAGDTRIKILPPNSRAAAKKTVLIGVALLGAGAVVTAISFMGEKNQTTYFLAMGLILFGFMQLMQGGMQYFQTIRQEKKEKLEREKTDSSSSES